MRPKTLNVRIPEELLAEAVRVAPSKLRRGASAVVQAGLKLFIIQRKRELFAKSMRQMARDPQAMAIDRQINKEFEVFDADGLEAPRSGQHDGNKSRGP